MTDNDNLKVIPIGLALPVPAVIEFLMEALELAERGDLRSVILCGEMRNGTMLNQSTDFDEPTKVLGALARMQYQVNNIMDEDMVIEELEGEDQ